LPLRSGIVAIVTGGGACEVGGGVVGGGVVGAAVVGCTGGAVVWTGVVATTPGVLLEVVLGVFLPLTNRKYARPPRHRSSRMISRMTRRA
jgi:hypothetical protein